MSGPKLRAAFEIPTIWQAALTHDKDVFILLGSCRNCSHSLSTRLLYPNSNILCHCTQLQSWQLPQTIYSCLRRSRSILPHIYRICRRRPSNLCLELRQWSISSCICLLLSCYANIHFLSWTIPERFGKESWKALVRNSCRYSRNCRNHWSWLFGNPRRSSKLWWNDSCEHDESKFKTWHYSKTKANHFSFL